MGPRPLGYLDSGYRSNPALVARVRKRLDKYGLNSPTSPSSPSRERSSDPPRPLLNEAPQAQQPPSQRPAKVVLKTGFWGKKYARGEHQIPEDPALAPALPPGPSSTARPSSSVARPSSVARCQAPLPRALPPGPIIAPSAAAAPAASAASRPSNPSRLQQLQELQRLQPQLRRPVVQPATPLQPQPTPSKKRLAPRADDRPTSRTSGSR